LKDFQKSSYTEFHENPFSVSRVVPCRQTDGWTKRNDKAKSHLSQFCERVWSGKFIHIGSRILL